MHLSRKEKKDLTTIITSTSQWDIKRNFNLVKKPFEVINARN